MKRSSKPEHADTDEYLDRWASQLAEALTPAELKSLHAEYAATAKTARRSKADRDAARRRANAIRKIM